MPVIAVLFFFEQVNFFSWSVANISAQALRSEWYRRCSKYQWTCSKDTRGHWYNTDWKKEARVVVVSPLCLCDTPVGENRVSTSELPIWGILYNMYPTSIVRARSLYSRYRSTPTAADSSVVCWVVRGVEKWTRSVFEQPFLYEKKKSILLFLLLKEHYDSGCCLLWSMIEHLML